jgi:hypothetical protein
MLLSANRSFVQVDQELKKMTAFIRQEAQEKAKEIEIKADEVWTAYVLRTGILSNRRGRNSQLRSQSSSVKKLLPSTPHTRRSSSRLPCPSRLPNPQSPTNHG